MGESFVSEILPALFTSWKQCFNITTVHPTAERDIVIFAKTRADALLPLHSLIVNCPKLMNSKMVASIVTFLSNTLKTVSELPAISTSFQISTNEITQMLELNLIRAFQALPASSYATQHTMLMTVVTSLILDGSHNTLLPTLYSKDDQDTLLPDFNCTSQQFESQFLVPLSSQDSSLVSLPHVSDCYLANLTQNLEVRVVNASIELFSTLFISQPDRHRTQLLDHFSNCIKECSNPQQKHVMTVNSMTTLLYILKSMVTSNMAFGKSDVASNIQRFVQRYFGDANPLLRRASAECLGVLCRLEGDNATTAIIKSLTEFIRKPSREVSSMVRAGSALVFGCIQRSVGGMMSQKHLPTTIANLHVLAQDQLAPEVCAHALHALYITIQSSGFSFNSFASPTLMLLQTILLGENPPYQLLGRVVNSIVIALGPELETNRDVLSKCTATCAIIKRHEIPVVRVESIYYLQKLIMFAPATVNESMTQVLISQFKSPFPMLRITAVTCLRQLINKKSFEVGMNVVEDLFMMIDTESDQNLQKEIKLLINTIIDNMAPNNPSIWLLLCMNIILSSKQMTKDSTIGEIALASSNNSTSNTATNSSPNASSNINNNDEDKDDDEDVKVVVQQGSSDKIEYVYRWFTKVFAIECVRRVISVVKNKPEHFNMLLAMAHNNNQSNLAQHRSTNNCLILHLHDLVGIAFKAATSQIDTMRPVGILLLKDILESFSTSIDPDYEGHLLLELYQAQIMSALRPAFSSDALPNLLSVGCTVFVNFVEGSLHYDSSALKKTTTQLSAPVKNLRNLNFPVYNEKATTLVQLSILKTFAQLYLLCRKKESLNTILSPVITPILPYLRVHWVTFLKEYSLLVSQPPSIYHVCNPMFFSPLSFNESVDYFKEAYPFVVKALASLIATPYWLEGRNVVEQQQQQQESTTTESTDINKTTTNDNNNNDPILIETKPMEDINLIMGLSLLPQEKFLLDPTEKTLNANHIALTLEIVALTLQPSSADINEFQLDRINEICQILQRVSSFANSNKIQTQLIEIINNLFQCFGDSIIKEVEIFNLLLKVLFDPMKPENEEYQIKFYSCCISIIKLMDIAQIQEYTPLFLWTVTQTLANTTNTNLITSAIQFTISLLRLFTSKVTPDLTQYTSILNASLTTTLDKLNKNETKQGLLLLLSTLIINQQEQMNDEITKSIVSFFRSSLQNKAIKEKQYSLQVLRNILNTGASNPPDSPTHRFSSKLIGELFIDLQSSLVMAPTTSSSSSSSEQDTTTIEIFKLFTLSLTLLKNDDQKCKLLQMIVQIMIFFLDPHQQPTSNIHQSTLQILLNYASTQPNFKEAVAALPIDQKQTLEQSIRQNFEQPAKKEIKLPAKPSIQLNFDFSKQIPNS
ncbi:hypothetical protein PPL_12617 [Heterostelium album PN500]|uniref:LAA1-like C-terminal TPR repeats domain-containing protein n=1 Tax=Heterostelium pallidum (strain ATCC 26659 / Pp 5 / PN500) TaxID=670386 RepID=D3BN39_HETP5|nr:hypothetical protein PPL_12617 [Heterostelium album PN500]EFA77401.1 hypothetical protein PPL_12617 [Heterostelium album PN500]|eukprot:XP_020429530.1 hypothetical protein PPL_12617 [Heterostelium album PN500]